jgi:predicted metalloprotease with PDZ domain
MNNVMKKYIFTLGALMSTITVLAGQDSAYHYKIDLNSVQDDKLEVELITPVMPGQEAIFHMPKIIPGTYSVYDFGRFVSGFRAYDRSGKELAVTRPDVNSWKISDAGSLYRVSYLVDDTWDHEDTSNVVFEPAGTNFEKDRNFVLNTNGLFGYFAGVKERRFEIEIAKPEGFYGSTALMARSSSATADIFETGSYMQLMDSPLMYCRPDTTNLNIGGAQILVSVYSTKNLLNSSFVASHVKEILLAARDYLGGSLPIRKYAFLIYLFPDKSLSGGSGALEHSYSSVYSLPEIKPEMIARNIRDVAAHEFYHIITPLAIHSEEIGNFDYQEPKMSRHLWLYEGVTEYTAGYVQLKQGLLSLDEYLEIIRQKISTSSTYYNDTLPFTEMSKGCLGPHSREYGNVYQKGALIGLCLDIKLRENSGGKYGLQDLINDLSAKYGTERSFKDEELFTVIGDLTGPGIKEFLENYVAGTRKLPLEEAFSSIGIRYRKAEVQKDFTFGGIGLGYNPQSRLFVADISRMDEFGKKLGYRKGDEIVSINGAEVNISNFKAFRKQWLESVREGDKMKIRVLRKDENGKIRKLTLKANAFKAEVTRHHILNPDPDPGETKLRIRNSWLGKTL